MRKDRYGEFRTAYEKNKRVILHTQTVCGICGQPVDMSLKSPDPMSATIDHIIPLDKGGHPSDISNLQLAHRWCNRQKSNKLFLESAREKPQLSREVNNDDLPLHFDWYHYKAKST